MWFWLCVITLWIAESFESESVGSAPKIQSVSAPKQISAGDDVRVLCLLEKGSFPLHFVWTKDNVALDPSDSIHINSLMEHTSLMSIKKSRASDSGNYSCNVRNAAGEDSLSFSLVINGS